MTLIQVTTDRLGMAEHLAAVDDEHCGAVVSFIGQVRNHDAQAPGTVTAIEYSAHPDAQTVLRALIQEIAAGGDGSPQHVVRIAASHRVRHLEAGDLALVVCVATAHRQQAYEISSAVVERIKVELPIWKKQHTADGTSHWSGL